MSTQLIFTPSEVQREDGKYFVECNCGQRMHLGAWGVAHLGVTDMRQVCGCDAVITITRGDDDED